MCSFCNFRESSPFAEKSLFLKKYDYKQIRAMGSSIQKDFDGNPILNIWTSLPQLGFQDSFNINYCPMCGRKLVEAQHDTRTD
ncbi:hypothetical protein DQM16_06630 [Levilactobacillus brevis]|nr:hypothetical protein DQM16_06630 [Levilactobacillus brevis]